MADKELIEWARDEAQRLKTAHPNTTSGLQATARARQFFADHASGSVFEEAARRAISYLNVEPAMKYVAEQLEEWATYEESAAATTKPFEVRFRVEASTDIMEQAHDLLKDPSVHVAAPIVLAGASLEEFLRSMVVEAGLTITGKPGINAYGRALQNATQIDRGEVKDITAWADQRNDAAHGNFANLDRARTQIMIDGINLFISKHT